MNERMAVVWTQLTSSYTVLLLRQNYWEIWTQGAEGWGWGARVWSYKQTFVTTFQRKPKLC